MSILKDLLMTTFSAFFLCSFVVIFTNMCYCAQIAITGKGFCSTSAIATGLIMNNILRIGKVNVIGDIVLLLGKFCVSLFCALFAFLMLDTHKYKSAHNKISSPLFPVLVRFSQIRYAHNIISAIS